MATANTTACRPCFHGFPLGVRAGRSFRRIDRDRFGPDACGPADPSYIRAANETGGIPLFLQRSEAAKSFHLVPESTKNNVATVLWATETLDGQPKTIRIPVDSVTKRITFTFSEDTKGNALKLTQPSGGSNYREYGEQRNAGRVGRRSCLPRRMVVLHTDFRQAVGH
jgi:hypothetical protein